MFLSEEEVENEISDGGEGKARPGAASAPFQAFFWRVTKPG